MKDKFITYEHNFSDIFRLSSYQHFPFPTNNFHN